MLQLYIFVTTKLRILYVSCSVFMLDASKVEKLTSDLVDQGFELTVLPHTFFSAKKKELSCTLYKSLKLVVQGKKSKEFIEFYLEPEVLGSFSHSIPETDTSLDTSAHIGVDEAGKGDFFGPLCIAGLFAEGSTIIELKKIGVKDSKTMSDKTIAKLAIEIKKLCPHHEIITIMPLKYNQMYASFKNLNSLLAWGHATVIANLVQKTSCQNVILDKFANDSVVLYALKKKGIAIPNLTQKTKAEQDLVVAGASILARHAFCDSMERLEKKMGVSLPKGASSMTVATAKKIYKESGPEIFMQIAKTHFKTFEQISM